MYYILFPYVTSSGDGKNSIAAEGPLDLYEISRLELEGIIDKNPSPLQKIEDFY